MMKRVRRAEKDDADRTVRRFSKSELQSMVDQAVYEAIRVTETQMDVLHEKVHQLECEPKYDLTMRHLESHIKKVKRRGDAAVAYVRAMGGLIEADSDQLQGMSSPSNTETSNDTVALPRSDFKEEKTTASKVTETYGVNDRSSSPQVKECVTVKEEPEEQPVEQPVGDPVVSAVRSECPSPWRPEQQQQQQSPPQAAASRTDTHTDQATRDQVIYGLSQQDKDDLLSRLPRLPPTPFPSTFPAAAASFTLPQKPVISFARIQHPPSLGVMWDIKNSDPAAPSIDSYSIFMAQESSNGSGVYPAWQRLGVVKAIPMPMAISVSEYRPGRRMCFIVVGKDVFGRYGPYSDVESVVLP